MNRYVYDELFRVCNGRGDIYEQERVGGLI